MKNVLIVDDSATMRRMIMASLGEIEGVSFDEAGSGLEAIERLALRRFDIVILDLNMPDMHGMEVLQFLRKHTAFQFLPVLVLTTRGDDVTRSEALQNGATAYMTKPFEPRALAQNVGNLLENTR